MSLRRKTLLAIALTLAALVAVLYGSLRIILLERFAQLETSEAGRDLERAFQGIATDIEQLRRTAIDWGVWDQTFAFVQGENPAFVADNLNDPGTFGYLDLNLLVIADRQGGLLFGQELGFSGRAFVAVDPALAEGLRPGAPLVAYTPENQFNLQGLARLPRHGGGSAVMLLVSQGVLPNDRQGAPAGTLLMARRLDAERVARIAHRTRLNLRLYDLQEALPPALAPVVAELSAGGAGAAAIRYRDDQTLEGYRLLHDLAGQPILLLGLEVPRAIYQQGLRALWALGGALLLIGLGFGAVTLWLLERLVLARLARLVSEVRQIDPAGLNERQVTASGGDELCKLADTLNQMLDGLNGAMHRLSAQQAQTERLLISALPEQIAAELPAASEPVERDEALRVAVARAQAAERAKNDFLANLSHEIRNPLNAILNLTRICLQDPLPERQRQRLEKVERSAGYLLALINGVLDFSRAEAGRIELERTPFRLADLLAALDIHAAEAEERGLWFRTRLGPGIPSLVWGDPLRVQQILRNLVGNAIKFTPQGGIEVAAELLRREGERAWIAFSVRDTGIGIAPHKLAQVFEPFRQAESATARHYGGSGLGLAICRRLTRYLGGEIEVESRAGAGSLFSVRLPFEVANEAAVPSAHDGGAASLPAPSLERLQGKRLLLIEDNEINRVVVQELLEAAGAQTVLAADGATALALALEGRYDGALMDIQMPGMDGYETARRLRQLPGWGALPILAFTASELPETHQRCRNAGMNDLIPKPIMAEGFYQTLGDWLAPDAATSAAESPPSGSPSVAEQLAQMRSHPQLHALFREHHGGDADTIRQALAGGGREQARRLAHDLKSAAGVVGEARLSALAKELETVLTDPAATPAASLLDELAAELARTLQG